MLTNTNCTYYSIDSFLERQEELIPAHTRKIPRSTAYYNASKGELGGYPVIKSDSYYIVAIPHAVKQYEEKELLIAMARAMGLGENSNLHTIVIKLTGRNCFADYPALKEYVQLDITLPEGKHSTSIRRNVIKTILKEKYNYKIKLFQTKKKYE